MKKEVLNEILMHDNVCDSIKNRLDELLNIVPQLKDIIGCEHKHPHHHLDVWEHTLLALSMSPKNLKIRLTLLLHDIGKPHCYQEEGNVRHFKNHPSVSSCIARDILINLGYENDYVEEICCLIEKHDSLISNRDIETNRELTIDRFKVQFCDALAHHPLKLEKRIKYLKLINEKLNTGELKRYYEDYLNKINSKIL